MFGRTLFRGSRFLFWSLAPFLVLFVIMMSLLIPDASTAGQLISGVLIAAALLLMLQLAHPARFHWAGRALAAIVFLAYAGFLADAIARGGIHLHRSRTGTSWLDALVGLIVIGIPSGIYAARGRWTWRREDREPDVRGPSSQRELHSPVEGPPHVHADRQ